MDTSITFGIGLTAWVVLAVVLGWFMRRRGFDGWAWTVTGIAFGPIAVVLAAVLSHRPPPAPPAVTAEGAGSRSGARVLVGTDGSAGSHAAILASKRLLDGVLGQLTLACVVPIDATPERLRLAEAQLVSDLEVAGRDATTVILRGAPAQALREHARTGGFTVLAAGTRGSGRTHAVLGSVSSALASGSHVPVLLVDAAAQPARAEAA